MNPETKVQLSDYPDFKFKSSNKKTPPQLTKIIERQTKKKSETISERLSFWDPKKAYLSKPTNRIEKFCDVMYICRMGLEDRQRERERERERD